MEINSKNPLSGLTTGVNRVDAASQQAKKAQKAGEGSSTVQSDRLDLSVRSQEIQQMYQLIQSTPDIREAKVEEVRGAIEDGTYNVQAEMIAGKIIAGSTIDQIF
jgi:negative regulator of flagellin synthesis FlgM